MSIVSSNPVNILPIYRAGIDKIKSPEIIARWNHSGFVTGDVSGGEMTDQCFFATGAIPFMYGSYGLIDLQVFSYESSAAPAWVSLRINLLEQSSPVVTFANEWALNASTLLDLERMIIPTFKFKVAPNAQAMIELRAANTNGVTLYFRCGGMVYDERIM